ncbi:type-F conjugative transfer system secretin TraK [Escherichia coli]|mgnify:FL=1|uniref:type-F conjugative transfer system secretin TraK n=2 Tax=Escherichia coli TaxID=562 RepID=UPI000B42BCEB|nr:type-F conjugative transfer system secretin TraK [Escherichia coli]HAX0257983.1 type-F conjugative transfer system secretin TraK [Escherichia coli G132]EET4449238.1 type-F conjugative transfer system secretin TraK [Escherichia coli]EET6037509.1 type-F conjugative transfer system secretin TraK [Escherichia coli]EEW1301652.1 type-F conjugative transfer system secretin TraK [Escherichia coli]EEX0367988.1 type-F conjugative transfer system secretin TraK [Escherichia coli]
MKNNFPALLLGTALMVTSPVTVYAQSPATLSFPQGGQFRLSISNTDPNMIFIPGDKVTAITAQNGMLADKRLTSAGGVLFTSVATRAFTLYVETALGQTFSVVATPVKGEGRVYRLMSAEPPSRPETRHWETAQAYEKLLIALNRAVLTDTMPDGYGEVKPLADGINVPDGFSATPQKAWSGDKLRVDSYELRNANTWGVALREQDFWKPGVRAVMFDSNAQTLMGGGRLTVTVIRENGEGTDGQR